MTTTLTANAAMLIPRLIFWVLFPFLLPQAIYVRKTAPRFAGAGGPKKGQTGTGKTLNLIAVGDSIIAGVGASDLSKALVGQTAEKLSQMLGCTIKWQAVGGIGADSKKIIDKLLPALPPHRADFIVLSVGVNDTTSLSSIRRWRQNLSKLLNALYRHSPDAVIAVAGIPPLGRFPLLPQPLRALFGLRGRTFDNIMRAEIARHINAVHVPLNFDPGPEKFSADGYHPSEASYRIFGEMVASQILARLTRIHKSE